MPANAGVQSNVRENFSLRASSVVPIPTSAGLILAGPTKQGQTAIIKAFSRVINTSGAARTVSFYLVPSPGAAADANSIGKDLSLPASQTLPFGEKDVPYGYAIYGVASGTGVQVSWDYLLED